MTEHSYIDNLYQTKSGKKEDCLYHNTLSFFVERVKLYICVFLQTLTGRTVDYWGGRGRGILILLHGTYICITCCRWHCVKFCWGRKNKIDKSFSYKEKWFFCLFPFVFIDEPLLTCHGIEKSSRKILDNLPRRLDQYPACIFRALTNQIRFGYCFSWPFIPFSAAQSVAGCQLVITWKSKNGIYRTFFSRQFWML